MGVKSSKKRDNFNLKKIVGTVGGKILLGALALFILSLSSLKIYVSGANSVPMVIKENNDKIVDLFLGKELAEKIDEKRDSTGATTIRELFNANKEENLVRHCEKKDEKGQEQEKCEDDEDEKVGKKKYENEEFGYEVNYPENWVQTKNENVVSLNDNSDLNRGLYLYGYLEQNQSAENWFNLKNADSEIKFRKASEFRVAGKTVIEFVQDSGLEEKHFVITDGSTVLDILVQGMNNEQAKEIINTIRF